MAAGRFFLKNLGGHRFLNPFQRTTTMSEVKQIKAVARDRAGKGAARAVRRQGQVPAVIYGAGQPARAIPRDYQLDPVRDFPVHVDFLRLAQGQAIKVVVPVHVVGQEKSPGVKRGGALQIVEHSVELLVPSDAIPDYIEASVDGLNIGDSVHLNDIKLPNGAKATSAENMTLVTVVAPTGLTEEDAAPAAAEGTAAA